MLFVTALALAAPLCLSWAHTESGRAAISPNPAVIHHPPHIYGRGKDDVPKNVDQIKPKPKDDFAQASESEESDSDESISSGLSYHLPTDCSDEFEPPLPPDFDFGGGYEQSEGFVYRGDITPPDEVRSAGGFRPWGEGWNDPLAYNMDRYWNAGPAGCAFNDREASAYTTVYTRATTDRGRNEWEGRWIYEIRATPNMLRGTSYSSELAVLGGIHWRQVRRYALVRNSPSVDLDAYEWTHNGDYNTALYEEPENAVHYHITEEPPRILLGVMDYTQANVSQHDEPMGSNDRGAMAVAIDFMRTTDGITLLYGNFPPTVAQDGIPRPENSRDQLEQDAAQGLLTLSRMGQVEEGQLSAHARRVLEQVRHHVGQGECRPSTSRDDSNRHSRRQVSEMGPKFLSGKGNENCCRAFSRVQRAMETCRPPKHTSNETQQTKKPVNKPASIVFYGHYLWPEEAKKQGGFLPVETKPPGPKYNVGGYKEDVEVDIKWATYLLPAHMTFGAAAETAAGHAARKTSGFAGVVYAVHATPNILSLGNHAAAVGGIRWSQVLGWMQVAENYTVPDFKSKEEVKAERAKLGEHFHRAFQQKMDLFSPNMDYDRRFDQYNTTVDVLKAFGAMDDLIEFMNEHGGPVGWTGHFPLFEAQVITGEASKAAKAKNEVPLPHEPSTWEKIWSWTKSHVVALALLPAAVALAFIPFIGEAAVAAEAAALAVESVETIELVETGGSALSTVGEGVADILRQLSKVKID